MILEIIANKEYHGIVEHQTKEVIDFLVKQNIEFAITANVLPIEFKPELPVVIKNKLSPFPMFVLANYTFSSLKLYDSYLEFEAGFGKENFGSFVKVPYIAIFQIVVDESILYLNPIATQTNLFEQVNNLQKSKSKLKLASNK